MVPKDMFRLIDFAYLIEEIDKIKEKYGIEKKKIVKVDNVTIKNEISRYDIYVNGNPWVSLNKGVFAAARLCAALPSKGHVKGPYRFLTTNLSVQSDEFVTKIYEKIKAGIPKLEEEYKEFSSRNWQL